MNPEIKAQWVADLRSGEYEQAKSYLASKGDGYCCLGVLCEQAVGAGVVNRTDGGDGRFYYGDGSDEEGEGNDITLPPSVANWAGLEADSPQIDGRHLSEMNDDDGKTFAEIADAIETGL
jgi:hypothetical protein